ncbi:LOW QUALITY PROTEIN: cysteine-rich repeat secretory protein 38-like [Arachis duranensis]|uniref:LOW QUALITY PROTEIN: cysteine-rich repeat secretory protein 38 n=1 Tax=Arachis duranensis TaxID=130453 RepID=A0A6P4B469_ARADU|nr:LOW QUALITY PROTEIN: cysteine-rich repeat secretory protein 38 [Arachis duranensis]XP_052112404.1 LOW QUALITY PROTEIN: cysteine-rich repeat secretory protein 38-like [Arachis duranensis]
MSSSSSSIIFTPKTLILLINTLLLLLVQTCHGAANDNPPLFHFCSNTGNYTPYTPYESNLKILINSLIYKTPSTGFGQFQNQQAYGLALCRGDASVGDCKTCVTDAAKELRSLCPYNKGAVIWYDNCEVKYSDTDFFGQVDNTNRFYLLNVQNVSDAATFNYVVKELLSLLASKASEDPRLYASGDLKVGECERVYGLAQCTRDLSSVDCNNCLHDAIHQLPSCCDGKQGVELLVEAATSDMRSTHFSINLRMVTL